MIQKSPKQKQVLFFPVYIYEKEGEKFHRKKILARFYRNKIEIRRKKGSIFYPLPGHPSHYLRGTCLSLYLDGTMIFPIGDPEIFANPQYSFRFSQCKAAELTRLIAENSNFANVSNSLKMARTHVEFDLILEQFLATGAPFQPLEVDIEKQIYYIKSGNPTWIIREVRIGPPDATFLERVAVDTGANIGLMMPEAAQKANVKKTGKWVMVKGYGEAIQRLEAVYLDIEYQGVTVRCLMVIDPKTKSIATVPIMVPVTVYFDFKKQNVHAD